MKLGTYRNLKVKGIDKTVSDVELKRSIINLQRKNALFYHIDERPAQAGDVVVLNYEGFLNGRPFAGGKATHHRMVLGEGKMVPGFEEQIVGKTMGDAFEIQVQFPLDYANSQLAGKAAVFFATLLLVGREEIPDFDDDFALDFSECTTAAEFAATLKLSLEAKKEASEYERVQADLLTQIIEVSDIPLDEDVLEELQEEVFAEKLEELELQGMSLETFLQKSHQTIEDVQYQCRKKARRSYEQTAVLNAIALEEGFDVTPEELEEAIYDAAFYADMEPLEFFDSMGEEELTGIKLQILCDKAMELVKETAEFI
ncbi:MAG: trigger factor [Eubacterium sp.]|nr:trigger factor [Eubacterium sp.]